MRKCWYLRYYAGMEKKDPGAVALAKKRAASLSPERRSEIARNAVRARWAKVKKTKGEKKV